MQWQDWVFSVGGFLILASLVPTIRVDQKPALTTSVMSVGLLSLFSVTMATLGLWLSALANASVAGAWAVLAAQRYSAMKRERHAGVLAQIEAEVMDVVAVDGEDKAASAVDLTSDEAEARLA